MWVRAARLISLSVFRLSKMWENFKLMVNLTRALPTSAALKVETVEKVVETRTRLIINFPLIYYDPV